jgi:hypothetical protein
MVSNAMDWLRYAGAGAVRVSCANDANQPARARMPAMTSNRGRSGLELLAPGTRWDLRHVAGGGIARHWNLSACRAIALRKVSPVRACRSFCSCA